MLRPQYELPELPREADPIFLPVGLVTGFGGETPMLRRVRETGDPLLLRMLVDLYGSLDVDVTMGVPVTQLYAGATTEGETPSRKLASVGAHAVWSLHRGTWRGGSGGSWASRHSVKEKGKTSWEPFWARLDLLKQIGAIYHETWVFDGAALDAEPLMPLDISGMYAVAEPEPEALLTRTAFEAARALMVEREYIMDNSGADFFLPLTLHRQPPVLRDVIRLRAEADTPGKRLAWRRRESLVRQHIAAFDRLKADASEGIFDRPLRLAVAADDL